MTRSGAFLACIAALLAQPAAAQLRNCGGVANGPTCTVVEGNVNGQPVPVTPGPIPTGATPVTAASGNVAASAATISLPAVSGRTNYVSGFSVTGLGATGAATLQITLGSLIGSVTQTYIYEVPAGATTAAPTLIVTFAPPLPASAANTAITLTVPSFGSGNTNASANIWGFLI
jgi:hypothetical protein